MEKVISWTFISKIDLAVSPPFIEHKVSLPRSQRLSTAAALNQSKQILSFLIFGLLGTCLVWVLAGSSAVVAFLISSLQMSVYTVPRLCHDRLLRNPSQFISHRLNYVECRKVTHKNKLHHVYHVASFLLRFTDPNFVAWLRPQSPPRFAWQRSALVSQALLPSYLSHMIAVTT